MRASPPPVPLIKLGGVVHVEAERRSALIRG